MVHAGYASHNSDRRQWKVHLIVTLLASAILGGLTWHWTHDFALTIYMLAVPWVFFLLLAAISLLSGLPFLAFLAWTAVWDWLKRRRQRWR